MTVWTLIKYAPLILALWARVSRTPFNDFAAWGGIISEVIAMIARMNGVEVPPVVDVVSVSAASGGVAHKAATAKERGFDVKEEWAKKAFAPKD